MKPPSFDVIAVDYDRMINWPARLDREIPQIHILFKENGVRSLIDFGCGTGRHALEFRKLGFAVTGVDSSVEMRRIALENAGSEPIPIVESLHMLKGTYDAVITIGNTLPSLISDRQLTSCFRRMSRLTRRGGLILIQVRNYEALQADQIVTTGLRETPEAIFFRAYHAEDTPGRKRMIHLHSFKLDRADGRLSPSGTISRVRGWNRNELRHGLTQTGYSDISFYSDYSRSGFIPESPDIVAVARKR